MKRVITISYATKADMQEVANFRIEQFKTAKEFELIDLEAAAKQRGKVFIAQLDGCIISTMQVETIENKSKFKEADTAFIPVEFNDYETIYLSKGASAKDFRNTGLNSYLRKLTLKEALLDPNIQSLSGTAYSNAPRLNLLKRLGYEIVEIPPDLNYAKPIGSEIFLRLTRDKFQTAYNILEHETTELENHFDIDLKITIP